MTEINKSNSNQTLEYRNQNANYSIVDGRLFFPTFNDYNTVSDFLRNSNISEIRNWRSSLGIITVSLAYQQFMDSYDNGTELTEDQINNLENSFVNKIKIKIDEYGIKEYLPKYPVLIEFINLDGVFQVGNTILKVTENKVISLVKPEKISDLSLINDSTPRDEELGILPRDIVVLGPECLCLNPSEKVCENNYGTYGRRFKIRYHAYWNHWSTELGKNSYLNYVNIDIRAYSTHQQKKFIGWWNQPINSTHTFRANGTITIESAGINVPWSRPQVSNSVQNRVYNDIYYNIPVGQFHTTTDDFAIKLCVNSVRQHIQRDGWPSDYSCLQQCN